jgi:hypothetical protein
MEIILTTPIEPGTLDPGTTYDRVRILNFSVDPLVRRIHVTMELGRRVDGEWRKGVLRPKTVEITDSSAPLYSEVFDSPLLPDSRFGPELARVACIAIQTAVPEFAGAIG